MRYLVTSHALAALVTVQNGRVGACRVLSRGYHYGAVRLQNGTGGFAVYRGGDSGERQNQPELLRFDMAGQLLQRQSLAGCADVHQIVEYDGALLLADTGNNRAAWLRDAVAADAHVFSGRREDWNHVNSLVLLPDRALALLHNKRRRESQVAVLRRRPEGLELEKLLSLWDVLCHNLFVDNQRLFYLASHANEIVIADLSRDRLERRIALSGPAQSLASGRGHVKGLSVAGGLITVGVSEFADRSARRSAQGCLVQLDRASLEVRHVVPLDALGEAVGNINEVQAIDASEEAALPRNAVARDWSQLRLAQAAPLRYAMMRVSLAALQPVVRLRRRWRTRPQD